jgi:hypothetical protein
MHYLARYVLAFALSVCCASLCSAQGFSVTSDAPPPSVQKSSEESQAFVSLLGRFTISLPKQVSAYSGIATNVPEGRIEGDSFSWETAEGVFEVSYMDLPAALAKKAVFDRGRDNRLLLNRKAKLAGEKDISLAGNAGRETRFETPEGIHIVRTYLVSSRLYEASVSLPNSLKPKEAAAVRVLDSLRLLSQAEVASARKKEADEVMPNPLPQDKPAPKLKSDAEDEGLKGKVKSVFRETQDLSGISAVGGRKPSGMDYYDEKGHFTKRESYDYRGNLFQVAVYGYVDGERVRNDKMIRHEYDPPPVMAAAPPAGEAKPTPTPDPRYSSRYRYKYDAKGRQVETVMYWNNGRLGGRTVRDFRDGQVETLTYNVDGKLVDKYIDTLDAKGNIVETSYFDVRTDTVRNRYSYAYDSFDARGNWVKKTTSKWVTKDGKSSFEPSYVTYRTITYY